MLLDGKNCHLNLGNDKNQVTFFYIEVSGPLHLALFFYSLNWTKIVQIFHLICRFTTFLLLDEQFLVNEQLRSTDFVKFCLKLSVCFNVILPKEQLNKNWKVDITALTACNLAFISLSLAALRDQSLKSINSV